jgi:hypothetical protein
MIYRGVFLKCAEILPTRLWDNVEGLKAIKKNVPQKLTVILFFDIFSEFFMKPSSSWLKFCRAFQGHPVAATT